MLAERPRVAPEQALIKDKKLMQSDQSIRHIALTCPHCGKHYKKVPYDAIKKHQFAFCKQCNNKFRVEPSVLEEALKEAAIALSGPDQSAQIHDMQTIPGLQNIVQQAAAAARDFLPEPSAADAPHDGDMLAKLFNSQQSEAEEQPGIKGSFEQDLNMLAATIDETFCQPQEAYPAENTGGVAAGNIFKDTVPDKAQVEHILETARKYPALSSVAASWEPEKIPDDVPPAYQPDEPAAKECLSRATVKHP